MTLNAINRKIVYANIVVFGLMLGAMVCYFLYEKANRPALKGPAFLEYIREHMEEDGLEARVFSAPDEKRFVPNQELYDPFFQTSAFAAIPLDLLQAVRKYEGSCRQSDFDRAAGIASEYSMSPSKFLEWHQAVCTKSFDKFQLWLERAPYIHPTGVSYAKQFSQARPKSEQGEAYYHISERATLTEFDKWYLALDLEDRRQYAAGFKAVAVGDYFAMAGEGTDQRRVFVFNLADVARDVRRSHDLDIFLKEKSPGCDFHQYGLCFAKYKGKTVWLNLQWKARWVAPVARFAGAYLLLAFVVSFLVWRREREQHNSNQALLFQVISHEIRTPLTSLKLSSDGLRQQFDGLDAESQRHVMSMLDSIYDLEKIVSKTLRELKGENKNLPHDLVAVSEDIIQHKYKDLVTVNVKEPSMMVSLPLFWYEISLVNLIRNALLHGKPPVTVTLFRQGRYACVEVCDTGEASLKTLSAFKNASLKLKSKHGLGIGLKIVARKMREVGGQLHVYSNPTRFVLKFEYQPDIKSESKDEA